MTPEQPIVSVLMTAYNREKYVAEAIESVLASTLTDFELIIVDDGSKDDTVKIAESYAAKDSRIKLFINEQNLGDYPNRNRAASYAKGKYLKYLDSDDIIYPTGLAVFVNSMEKFPDAAVGVTSSLGQEEKPFPFVLSPAEAYQYNFYKTGLFDIGPSGLIFHTERFRAVGCFSGKRYVGDTEINLKLAMKWPVVRIGAALIFWRQHEGQEFAAGLNTTGYLELQLPMYREAFSKAECPLPENKKRDILQYHKKIAARQIMKIALQKKDPALALQFYKKLALSPADILNAALFMKKRY
jgi:glycosyltransferase involved in cell wall biosynthesis